MIIIDNSFTQVRLVRQVDNAKYSLITFIPTKVAKVGTELHVQSPSGSSEHSEYDGKAIYIVEEVYKNSEVDQETMLRNRVKYKDWQYRTTKWLEFYNW